MNKYLIITSINNPTKAVKNYAQMQGWNIVMVGDKKTPDDWDCDNIEYLSPDKQANLKFSIINELPWNQPSRANIGYLYAMEKKADSITQSDDDNIPNKFWGLPNDDQEMSIIDTNSFTNVYSNFTNEFIWPRGYPLDKILNSKRAIESKGKLKVAIWQHLADGDTDVDAIYRLTNNKTISFNQRDPLALSRNTVCPFNCQSTTFFKESYVLLYLPSYITPRSSDIVRGLIAQPLLWSIERNLGFTSPTVTQERNPHNYLKDFEEEILIYLNSEKIIEIANEAINSDYSLHENLIKVYGSLIFNKILPDKEMDALQCWVNDVLALSK